MSSQFYTSIAKYYRYIFPFNPEQIDFLRKVLPFNGAKVLDAGCATGDLSFAIAQLGFPVWAFDFDAQMVEIAQNSKADDSMFPVFEQSDMRLMDERYPENYFHTIVCFGNTLVHLLSDDDIMKFFRAAHKILSPEGKLTIQILNYNYIIDNQIKMLPQIENQQIRFEREYSYNKGGGLIDFNTKLTVKSSGEVIANSVKLYAIRQNKLQEMLEEAGFWNFEFFGNFKGDPVSSTMLPLIVTCQK